MLAACGLSTALTIQAHLPALEALRDIVQLKALYSKSAASAVIAAEEHLNRQNSQSNAEDRCRVDIYSDDSKNSLDDLLRRNDIQLCVIALPIMVQPDIILRCLQAGKHVLR
jgi:predicted dehydrogenase